MKKYLIVTGILSFLLVSLIYSYFFIPGIKEKLNFKITKVSETSVTSQDLLETSPDLTINTKDFKQIIFSKLTLQVEKDSQIETKVNQVSIKKNANERIEGIFFPLNATSIETTPGGPENLFSYKYSFKTPNNLGENFLQEIAENYVPNYQIEDSSFNSKVTLNLTTLIPTLDSNLLAFYFTNESRDRAKVVILTKENLYVFNIITSPENINKIEKTFYNISLVK